MTTVFLRKIEYFQGVLFLTTNRKQDFDEAFKSRIHVTISYGDLSDEAQSMIWEQLITTNKDVQKDDSWTGAYSALGKLKLNVSSLRLSLDRSTSLMDPGRAGPSRTSCGLLSHTPTLMGRYSVFVMF